MSEKCFNCSLLELSSKRGGFICLQLVSHQTLFLSFTNCSNLVLHFLCPLIFHTKKNPTCSLLLTLVKPLHQLDYQQNPDTGQKIFQWDMVSTIQVFLQFYHSYLLGQVLTTLDQLYIPLG